MPKFSKGHNSGYKWQFLEQFSRGGNSTIGVCVGGGGISCFPGGGGGILLPEHCTVIFPGEILVADNHSRFPRGKGEKWVYDKTRW